MATKKKMTAEEKKKAVMARLKKQREAGVKKAKAKVGKKTTPNGKEKTQKRMRLGGTHRAAKKY